MDDKEEQKALEAAMKFSKHVNETLLRWSKEMGRPAGFLGDTEGALLDLFDRFLMEPCSLCGTKGTCKICTLPPAPSGSGFFTEQ